MRRRDLDQTRAGATMIFAGLLSILAACPACDSIASKRIDSAARSSSSSSAADAPNGAAAPGNDPTIVALATLALSCKWEAEPAMGLSRECAAALAWSDATQGFVRGRGDDTLVNMLGDVDERVRWLGASKLHTSGKRYREEKALADRVVTASERETSPRVGAALGLAVADIQLEKTQTFDRIRAMGVHHALVPLRVTLIANLAWHNPSSAGAYELTREMVRDSEKDVRLAAIQAFWMAGSRRPEDTCRIWRDNLDTALDDDVEAFANELLAHFGRCQAYYDALLDSLDRRLKASLMTRPGFASALAYLCQDAKSTRDQRGRASIILQRTADLGTALPVVRGASLAALLECDPANGKAFVKKFTADDQQAQLREIAADLLKPTSK